jgi:hemerythrin
METKQGGGAVLLGLPLFDETHQALADQVSKLLAGPDEQFEDGLELLVEALEQDFRVEETLMEDIGYPALRSHREQHARVLATLHHLSPGEIDTGRQALSLFLPWFEVHQATADAALVIALQMAEQGQQDGGVPVQQQTSP